MIKVGRKREKVNLVYIFKPTFYLIKNIYFVGYGNPRKHIPVWQHLINNYKGEEKRTTRRVP